MTAPPLPRPGLPPFHSIGLRLTLALVVLLLTLAGAGLVAVQALTDIRGLLDRIATEDMAATQTASALAQDSQSLLGHSPRLALSTDAVSLMGNRAFILDQMRQMEGLIIRLEQRGSSDHLAIVRQAQLTLRQKLEESVDKVGQRNDAVLRMTRRQQELIALADQIAAALTPAEQSVALPWLATAQNLLPRLATLLTSTGYASATPLEAAVRAGGEALDTHYAALPPPLRARVLPLQQALHTLIDGPSSIATQRRDLQTAQMAVQASVRVSKQAADDLAAAALSVMRDVEDQVQQQRRSSALRGQTAMALLVTGGIVATAVTLLVFAYIRRSLVGRLRHLRDMVLAAEDRQPVSVPHVIRDEIDDIGRAVGALVTTLAGRETTLRHSEEQLRLLVENAPFPLVVADRRSGHVAFANDQAQQILISPPPSSDPKSSAQNAFGESPPPAEPARFFDTIVEAEERDRLRIAITESAQASGRELRMRGKLGPFWAVLSASPVSFQGRPCILFAVQDIDGLKAAEERLSQLVRDLERSNADLEQFASAASHDLRDPLRTVSGYLALLARRLAPHFDAECHEFIGYAQDGIRRMDQLTTDLLDLARVGRSGAPVPVALSPVLSTVLSTLSPLIEEAKAIVTLPPSLPAVLGRESDLTRLFQNLIANALKYRAQDRPLTISLWCQPAAPPAQGMWHFTLSDTGKGIPRDQQERVFLMFQRLQDGGQSEGTGIGLTLCRKIVEGHGGRIWLESRLGEGSSFHFTLPQNPETQSPETQSPAP